MAQVTLTIPDKLYQRARQLAEQRQLAVEDILATLLNATENAMENLVPEPDTAIDQEMAAYIEMHPQLWQQYPGRHVAIYQGQLVDHDEDYGALYERIITQYPDEYVWLTTVKAVPIETIAMRSPRFVLEES